MLGFKSSPLGSALPHHARCDLQHVRLSATHDQPAHIETLPGKGKLRLESAGGLSADPCSELESATASLLVSSAEAPALGEAAHSQRAAAAAGLLQPELAWWA